MSEKAARICAILLREGYVHRDDLPALRDPTVKEAVEGRLRDVGLELVSTSYTPHYGVRQRAEIEADEAFDSPSNETALKSDACALLVILWTRLALQRRTGQDQLETPGQAALTLEGKVERAEDYDPTIRQEAIMEEFGDVLGTRSHIKRLLTQLGRLGFIERRGSIIRAGPNLELAIDGDRMMSFVRDRLIADLLERAGEIPEADPTDTLEHELEKLLREEGRALSIGELESQLDADRDDLREAIDVLRDEGKIQRIGEGTNSAYRLASQENVGEAA
jgi:predicted transcriptional regulator